MDNIPESDGIEMINIHVDIQSMEKLVSDINSHKASSVPNLTTNVLKDAFSVIVPQLVYLFKLSFDPGVYPAAWKIANVMPLKKGGNPTDVNNLRPISLLPLPGKMAERFMHSHISKFLDDHELLNKNQG